MNIPRSHSPFVICLVLLNISALSGSLQNSTLPRQKRAYTPLIFPLSSPARSVAIIGFGIPLENLLFEAMTTGYVFKAIYNLPSTAAALRTKTRKPIGTGRSHAKTKFEQFSVGADELPTSSANFSKRKPVLTSYRWAVYKGLEGLAERIGLPGRACVLKSICETAEVPFHYRNGLFAELLHVLLTPSTSADALSEHADNDYFQAESLGRAGAQCDSIFRECRKSLIDHFSDVYTLTGNVAKLLG